MRSALFLPQQGIISRVKSSPADWTGITAAWEIDGDTADSSGWLKDEVGGSHLALVQAPVPTKVTGVLGDARHALVSASNQVYGVRATGLQSVNGNSYTVMGFARPHSDPVARTNHTPLITLSSTGIAGFSNFLTAHIRTDNYIQLYQATSGTRVIGWEYVPDGTWVHIAVTCTWISSSRAQYRLYINGVLNGTSDTTTWWHALGTDGYMSTNVGQSGWKSGSDYDLFRFWDGRVLTLEQIQGHYNGGLGKAYLT